MIQWLLTIGMGIWFAMLAYKTRRSWPLWALGGALFSLVVSTIVLGLCQAVSIPMSHSDSIKLRIKSDALAILAVVLFVGIPGMIAHHVRGPGQKTPSQQLPAKPEA
jgi:hypothetical protein